jgi:hypothetical protein
MPIAALFERRIPRSVMGGAWFTVPVLLCSCASGSPAREEFDKLRALPSLPRCIALRVHVGPESAASAADASGVPDTSAPFGTLQSWQEDLRRVFVELEVGSGVVESEAEADLVVDVQVSKPRATRAEIVAQGALLSFLAWSTVPLLPWWIEEVEVDLGLELEVETSLREDWDTRKPPLPGPVDRTKLSAPPELTCLLDRRPPISWQTLAALFVPPFVFREADPERLEQRVGASLRARAAFAVAKLVKETPHDSELLGEPKLRWEGDRLLLEFKPHRDLGQIWYRFSDEDSPPTQCRGKPSYDVTPPIESPASSSRFLRVWADDLQARLTLPYSLAVPPRPGNDALAVKGAER